MKDLYHPNVIILKNAFYTQGDKVSFQTLSQIQINGNLARRNLLKCGNGIHAGDSVQSIEALQQNEDARANSACEALHLPNI